MNEWVWTIGGMIMAAERKSASLKSVKMPFLYHKSHTTLWDWIQASAVTSRRQGSLDITKFFYWYFPYYETEVWDMN
jgi:hypothetical protein